MNKHIFVRDSGLSHHNRYQYIIWLAPHLTFNCEARGTVKIFHYTGLYNVIWHYANCWSHPHQENAPIAVLFFLAGNECQVNYLWWCTTSICKLLASCSKCFLSYNILEFIPFVSTSYKGSSTILSLSSSSSLLSFSLSSPFVLTSRSALTISLSLSISVSVMSSCSSSSSSSSLVIL